jgi:hypothetical protein
MKTSVAVFQEYYTFQRHAESSQRSSLKVSSTQTKLLGIASGFRYNRLTIDRIFSVHRFGRKRERGMHYV